MLAAWSTVVSSNDMIRNCPKIRQEKNNIFLEWHILRRTQWFCFLLQTFLHLHWRPGGMGVIRSQLDEVKGFRSIILENPEAWAPGLSSLNPQLTFYERRSPRSTVKPLCLANIWQDILALQNMYQRMEMCPPIPDSFTRSTNQ